MFVYWRLSSTFGRPRLIRPRKSAVQITPEREACSTWLVADRKPQDHLVDVISCLHRANEKKKKVNQWGFFCSSFLQQCFVDLALKSELSAAVSRISLVANQLVLVKEAVHRPLILIPLNATRLDDRLRD